MSDSYRVIFRDEVLDDLKVLPRNIQERIMRAVDERLEKGPSRYGSCLRRSLLGLWKIRVGDYRVVYEITGGTVRVWVVDHRKKAYAEALKRWARR